MSNLRDWLSVIMEEYKTIYKEALTALQMQHATLRFATAILSIVVTACAYIFTKQSETNSSQLNLLVFLLCFVVVVTSCVVTLVWLHEVARMVRTTVRLKEIENEVNSMFPDRAKPLDWIKLVAGRTVIYDIIAKTNYIAVIALFGLPPICAIIVGYSVMKFPSSFLVIDIFGICFVFFTLVSVVLKCIEIVKYDKLTKR